MTKKIKIGNVYAILLPDSTYAFGKIYKDGCVGFYKERALNKKNLPKYEDFQFIVGVYKDVIRESDIANSLIMNGMPYIYIFKDDDISFLNIISGKVDVKFDEGLVLNKIYNNSVIMSGISKKTWKRCLL